MNKVVNSLAALNLLAGAPAVNGTPAANGLAGLPSDLVSILGDRTVSQGQQGQMGMAQSTREAINGLNEKAEKDVKLRQLAQSLRVATDATNVAQVKQYMEQVELNPDYIFDEMKRQCPQYVNEGTKGCIEAAWMHPEIKNKIMSRVQNLKEGEKINWGLLAVWLDTSDILKHPENSYDYFDLTEQYCTAENKAVVIDRSKIGNGEVVTIPFSLNTICLIPINLKPLEKGASYSCTIVGGSYRHNFSVDNSSDGTVTVEGANLVGFREADGTLTFSNRKLTLGDKIVVATANMEGVRDVKEYEVCPGFDISKIYPYTGYEKCCTIEKQELTKDLLSNIMCKYFKCEPSELPSHRDKIGNNGNPSSADLEDIRNFILSYKGFVTCNGGKDLSWIFYARNPLAIKLCDTNGVSGNPISFSEGGDDPNAKLKAEIDSTLKAPLSYTKEFDLSNFTQWDDNKLSSITNVQECDSLMDAIDSQVDLITAESEKATKKSKDLLTLLLKIGDNSALSDERSKVEEKKSKVDNDIKELDKSSETLTALREKAFNQKLALIEKDENAKDSIAMQVMDPLISKFGQEYAMVSFSGPFFDEVSGDETSDQILETIKRGDDAYLTMLANIYPNWKADCDSVSAVLTRDGSRRSDDEWFQSFVSNLRNFYGMAVNKRKEIDARYHEDREKLVEKYNKAKQEEQKALQERNKKQAKDSCQYWFDKVPKKINENIEGASNLETEQTNARTTLENTEATIEEYRAASIKLERALKTYEDNQRKEKQEGNDIFNKAQTSLTFINTITPQTDTSAIIQHKKLLVEYRGQLFPISEKYGNCFSVEIDNMDAGIEKAGNALQNVSDEDLAYASFEGDEKNFESVWKIGDKGQISAYLKTLDGLKKEADNVNVNGIYNTERRNTLLQSYNTIKETVVDHVNSIKPIINPEEINEQNFGEYEKQVSDFYLWVSNLPEEFRLDLGNYSDVEKISEKIQSCRINKENLEKQLVDLDEEGSKLAQEKISDSDTLALHQRVAKADLWLPGYYKVTTTLGVFSGEKQGLYQQIVSARNDRWDIVKGWENEGLHLQYFEDLVATYTEVKDDYVKLKKFYIDFQSAWKRVVECEENPDGWNRERFLSAKSDYDHLLNVIAGDLSHMECEMQNENTILANIGVANTYIRDSIPADVASVSLEHYPLFQKAGDLIAIVPENRRLEIELLSQYFNGKDQIDNLLLGLKNRAGAQETTLNSYKIDYSSLLQKYGQMDVTQFSKEQLTSISGEVGSALKTLGTNISAVEKILPLAKNVAEQCNKYSETKDAGESLQKVIDQREKDIEAGKTQEGSLKTLNGQITSQIDAIDSQEQQQQMEGQFTTSLTTLQGYLGEDIMTKSKVDLLTLSANISSEKETLFGLAKTLNEDITAILQKADQKIEDIKKQIASVETEEERMDWINAFIGVLSKFTNDANTGGTIAQMSKSKFGLDSVITIASDSIFLWHWEKRIEDAIDGDPTFSFAIALGGAESKSVDLKNSIADTKKTYDNCKKIYDPLADKKYDPTIAGGKEADKARNDAKTKVDNPNDFTKDEFESAGKVLKQKNADYDANKQSVDDAANAQKKVDQVNALKPNLGENPLEWKEGLKPWNDAYNNLSPAEKEKVTDAKHFIGATKISERWTSLSNDIQKSGEKPSEGLSYGDDGKWYLNKQATIAGQNQCTGSFEYVLQNANLSAIYSENFEGFGDLKAVIAQRPVADMIKQLSADSVYNAYMDSLVWFDSLGTQYEALKTEVGYNPETSSVTCDKLDILKKVVKDGNDLEHVYGESFLGLQEFMNSEKFNSLVDDKKEKLQELYDQFVGYLGSGDGTEWDGSIRVFVTECERKIQEIENSEPTPVSEVTPENNANMFYDGESIYVPNVKQGEIIRIFTVAGQYLGSHKVPTDGIFKVPFHNNILPYPIVVVKVGDQKGVKVRVK